MKAVDGAAEETAVLKGGALFKEPSSWSADGKTIIFEQPDPRRDGTSTCCPPTARARPASSTASRLERYGVVSPNGRWSPSSSDEAGRMELFVQSFPAPGEVSGLERRRGLRHDAWTRGGKELMWLAADGFTVSRRGGDRDVVSRRRAARALQAASRRHQRRLSPDGERITGRGARGRASVPLDHARDELRSC